MKKGREFSTMKWLFVVLLTLVLGGITSFFNLRIFGVEEGFPYIMAVGCMGGGAIGIAHYVNSRNKVLARAAFTFDILLFAVLIVSAAYSISGLRELGLARQVNADQNAAIHEVSGLRSPAAQREGMHMLAAKYSQSEGVQKIFARYERPLFYLLIAELSLFGLAMFVLIGIALLPDRDGDGVPDMFQQVEPRLYLQESRPVLSAPMSLQVTAGKTSGNGKTPTWVEEETGDDEIGVEQRPKK